MEKNIILILHYYLLNASYLHTVPLTSVQPGPSAAVQSRWITKMSVQFPYFIKAKSIFLFCSDNKSWRAESGVTWSPSAFWPSPLVGKTRQPKSACEFAPCVNACFPEWSKRWNVLCVGLLIRRGADQHSVIPRQDPRYAGLTVKRAPCFPLLPPLWNLTTAAFLMSCTSLSLVITSCMCRSVPRAHHRLAALAHSWHVLIQNVFSLKWKGGKTSYNVLDLLEAADKILTIYTLAINCNIYILCCIVFFCSDSCNYCLMQLLRRSITWLHIKVPANMKKPCRQLTVMHL